MLLDKAGEVEKDPFPHLVLENALPNEYYNALLASRPTPDEIIRGREVGPNQRIDLPTEYAKRDLWPLWRSFCTVHSSPEFVEKICQVFGIEVPKTFTIRCQPGLNTPSPTLSRVRGPHLDNPKELFAGLFYMPTDFDGGDLEIYRWKEGPKKFHGKLEVEDECVELVKTIKYRPNTLVMFLNTINSLHGVTPRKSDHYRNLVNICVDVPQPLFVVGHGRY